VVLEPSLAVRQLCGLGPDAGPITGDPKSRAHSRCEDGQLYRCVGGEVVDCTGEWVIASCIRGCATEGTSIDDDGVPVRREAAFAILCSR
jgi:hypothetical protein